MRIKGIHRIFFFILLVGLGVSACNSNLENSTYHVSDEMTIAEILDENPDVFSVYTDILHITGFYSALQSYGSYSCFVPENDVWLAYIQDRWQVNSVEELTTTAQIESLRELVKFHTMAKSRGVSSFIEGRMSDTTYTGDFLTTSFMLGGGVSNILINKEAKLRKFDIHGDNGYIHSIDHVLTPYSDALPKTLEKGGKHTIFVEALHKTGLYETFSEEQTLEGGKKNFTIFTETDSVFALSGIYSFEDLAAKYADSTDYNDVNNGLNRFIAYHAASAFLYSADMPADGFISTVLENNAIKVLKTDKTLKFNETETGTDDTWISLIMDESNIPASNGVYHCVDTLMDIFTPLAKHIMFDAVSDQPEIQAKMVASHTYVPSSTYEYVRWYPDANLRYMRQSTNPTYYYTTFSLVGCIWYEFDTPIIPKGKYEFLICGNAGNSARGQYQIYWDGEPIGAIYDATASANKIGFPDSVRMEAMGWRHGKKELVDKYGTSAYDVRAWSRFVVTKELLCPVQKKHTIRLLTVKDGGLGMDYFEWIPVP